VNQTSCVAAVARGITSASRVAFVKSGQIVDEIENVLEGIMKDPLGPDAVWASIEGKIRGHYLAAQTLPASCPQCAKILEPVDFGVDPDSNERLWVTHCCGNWEKFYEKLGPADLI
jgi:hypothetical protein